MDNSIILNHAKLIAILKEIQKLFIKNQDRQNNSIVSLKKTYCFLFTSMHVSTVKEGSLKNIQLNFILKQGKLVEKRKKNLFGPVWFFLYFKKTFRKHPFIISLNDPSLQCIIRFFFEQHHCSQKFCSFVKISFVHINYVHLNG